MQKPREFFFLRIHKTADKNGFHTVGASKNRPQFLQANLHYPTLYSPQLYHCKCSISAVTTSSHSV